MNYKLKGKKHIGSSNAGWKRFFIWFTVAQVAIVVILLALLWISLGGAKFVISHKDNPQLTADQIVQKLMDKDYSILEQADGFLLSRYETPQVRQRYLENRIRSQAQQLSAESAGQEGEDFLYDVTNGSSIVAQLVLVRQDTETGYAIKEIRKVFEPLSEYSITAPVDAKLLVNGVPLREEAVQTMTVVGFEDLPEGLPVPAVTSYTLTGLLTPPEVTSKEAFYQRTEREDGNGVVFTAKIPQENEQSRITYAKKLALLYIQFVCKEISYEAIHGYLLPGGIAEKELSGFEGFVETAQGKLVFEQEQILQMQQYDDNTLMCEVSVTYAYIAAQGEEKQTATVTIFLSRSTKDGPFYVHRIF